MQCNTMLGESAQERRLGDATFASQRRAHFAGLAASDKLSQLARREAIGQSISLSLANCLLRAWLGLVSIHPLQCGRDGTQLIHIVANMLRLIC